MHVPLGLRPVGADGLTATLVPQRPRPRQTPPWDNAAQLVLALLLVPTALVLAIGRTLWRRPRLPGRRGHAPGRRSLERRGRGEVPRASALADVAAVGLVSLVLARALVIGDTVRLRSWVLLPMAAVFGACGAATVMAADGVTSLVGMAPSSRSSSPSLATYLALERRSDLSLILGTLLAIGIGEGVLGVYQFVTGSRPASGTPRSAPSVRSGPTRSCRSPPSSPMRCWSRLPS